MNQMSLKPAIAQTNPILVNIQHPRFSGPKYVFSTLLNHDLYWFLKKWVSIAEAILFIARSPPISLAGASISRGSTLWSTTICPMRVTGPKAEARWGSRNSWNSWVIYRLKFECIKLFFVLLCDDFYTSFHWRKWNHLGEVHLQGHHSSSSF